MMRAQVKKNECDCLFLIGALSLVGYNQEITIARKNFSKNKKKKHSAKYLLIPSVLKFSMLVDLQMFPTKMQFFRKQKINLPNSDKHQLRKSLTSLLTILLEINRM